jgi:hypothetical protein
MRYKKRMPRKPSQNVVSITIKVPQSILDDALAAAKGSPDSDLSNMTRTDMLRIAMRRGLDAILAQQKQPPQLAVKAKRTSP